MNISCKTFPTQNFYNFILTTALETQNESDRHREVCCCLAHYLLDIFVQSSVSDLAQG